MGAQVGKAAAVIEPVGLLQLLKHADKTLGRKAGLRHHAKANAVGLALHVAREIELALHCGGLPAGNQRVGRLTVGIALAGRQHTQNHGAHHPGRLRALVRHVAGNVALGHVAQLVAQHRGEFVAVAYHPHQPQVHAKVAPGQGKSVDRAVAPQQQFPGKGVSNLGRHLATRLGGRQQRLPQALHIFHGDRVVQIVGVAVQAARNVVAQAALGGRRHLGAVAQVGQRVGRPGFNRQRLRLQRAGRPSQRQRQGARKQPQWRAAHLWRVLGLAIIRWCHARMMHLIGEALVNARFISAAGCGAR